VVPWRVHVVFAGWCTGLERVDLLETTHIVAAALLKTAHWGALSTPSSGLVGFDTIDAQIQRKHRKRGYVLNLLVVGESGLGKTSFIDTLFRATVCRTSCDPDQAGLIPESTVQVHSVTHGGHAPYPPRPYCRLQVNARLYCLLGPSVMRNQHSRSWLTQLPRGPMFLLLCPLHYPPHSA